MVATETLRPRPPRIADGHSGASTAPAWPLRRGGGDTPHDRLHHTAIAPWSVAPPHQSETYSAQVPVPATSIARIDCPSTTVSRQPASPGAPFGGASTLPVLRVPGESTYGRRAGPRGSTALDCRYGGRLLPALCWQSLEYTPRLQVSLWALPDDIPRKNSTECSISVMQKFGCGHRGCSPQTETTTYNPVTLQCPCLRGVAGLHPHRKSLHTWAHSRGAASADTAAVRRVSVTARSAVGLSSAAAGRAPRAASKQEQPTADSQSRVCPPLGDPNHTCETPQFPRDLCSPHQHRPPPHHHLPPHPRHLANPRFPFESLPAPQRPLPLHAHRPAQQDLRRQSRFVYYTNH